MLNSTRLAVKEPLLASQRTFATNSSPRKALPRRTGMDIVEEFDAAFANLQLVHTPFNDNPSSTCTIHASSIPSRLPSTTVQPPSFKAPPYRLPASRMEPPAPSKPLYSFRRYSPDMDLIYITTRSQTNEEIPKLTGPLGFDMEWKVIYGARQCKTAVIQVCDEKTILIIQLSAMRPTFPEKLKELVESPTTYKLGLNIGGDGKKLFRDYGISPKGLVDLGDLMHYVDKEHMATRNRKRIPLQEIVEYYTDHTLDKGPVRTSNWELNPLSHEQLAYAANDAHCALRVYNIMKQRAEDKGLVFDIAQFADRVSEPRTPKVRPATSVKPSPAVPARTRVAKDSTSDAQSQASAAGGAGSGSSKATNSKAVRPSHQRAYDLWHQRGLSIDELRAELRSPENPLTKSTVIGYIVGALVANRDLAYDRERLIQLTQDNKYIWERHSWWIQRK
ncbi:hypothetical protein M422DRAFT_35468 [Sphaerobolus stellatus SS14]|uniref:3'-5' exonuclease domain-containing protein n=1 Tax=Sphaerobolus stellatus (strain SS14) TaxID=990650 RepID=A0A0C9UWB2_SPHS4|nr:hypothetical protein M422DRAFT_35468 [Sphaerobolus stellatus SS14]